MRSPTRLALVAAVLLAGPPALHADDAPAFASVEDGSKKVGAGSVVLVVFTKEGSEQEKAAKTALVDKRLAKPFKDGAVCVRVDPGDDEQAKKLGVSAEKAECTVVLDGYGLPCGKHEKAPSADALAKLLRSAEETTAKKKKVEKAIDAAVKRAVAAMKKDDTATACQAVAPTLEYEKTVPCAAMKSARELVDELKKKADAVLEKAREATSAGTYALAHKLIAEVNADYPLPEILEEAKKAKQELGEAEAADGG